MSVDPHDVLEFLRLPKIAGRQRQHLPRLAELVNHALSVWEDENLAREFLTNPQPGTGGLSPVELALSGGDLSTIRDRLHRLEYSLPI